MKSFAEHQKDIINELDMSGVTPSPEVINTINQLATARVSNMVIAQQHIAVLQMNRSHNYAKAEAKVFMATKDIATRASFGLKTGVHSN